MDKTAFASGDSFKPAKYFTIKSDSNRPFAPTSSSVNGIKWLTIDQLLPFHSSLSALDVMEIFIFLFVLSYVFSGICKASFANLDANAEGRNGHFSKAGKFIGRFSSGQFV